MIKRPDAVITDMDGSLLGPTPECAIGRQDIATIRRLKELGIPVFVATGRHHGICRWYFDELGTDYPTITCNGAILYDFATSTIIEQAQLSDEDVAALAQFADRNGLAYYIHTDTQCILNPSKADSPNYQMDLRLCQRAREDEQGMMGDDFDLGAHTVIKFMIPDCKPDHYKLFEQDPVSKRVEAAFSWHDFLDISPNGANKGNAVRKLAARYGLDTANIVALGDNFNDESMLRAVGYPVVPASGEPKMQELARLVTKRNGDNPLTYAIETLFPGVLR